MNLDEVKVTIYQEYDGIAVEVKEWNLIDKEYQTRLYKRIDGKDNAAEILVYIFNQMGITADWEESY